MNKDSKDKTKMDLISDTKSHSQNKLKQEKSFENSSLVMHFSFGFDTDEDEDAMDAMDEIDKIIEMYKNKYGQESWYTPPKKPKKKGGVVGFETEEELMKFAEIAAQNGVVGIAISHGKVIAYSNGDGKLYKNKEGRSISEISYELFWKPFLPDKMKNY